MRRAIWAALVVAFFGVMNPALAQSAEPAGQQLLLTARVVECQWHEGRAGAVLKVLAEPCVVTLENRPFSLVAGGEVVVDGVEAKQTVPFGLMMEGKPGKVVDGQVRLELKLTNTTVVEHGEPCTQLHADSMHVFLTARLGETMRLRFGQAAGERQAFAELTVEQVQVPEE